MKILYVEDEISISNLAKIIFMRTSHELIVCPKLKETKAILDTEDIGLVILDMTFPTFSGLDILEHIAKHKIKTPVIIYSGNIEKYEARLKMYVDLKVILKIYKKPYGDFNEMVLFVDNMK